MKTQLKLLLFLFCISFTQAATAQFNDAFSDGNFSSNPTWTGNTSDFIINPAFQLQSENNTTNAGFYLSTASTKATDAQWEFYARLNFNPSSTNYVDIFLIASAEDISAASTTGYFVRLGGTNDEISLFRKDAGGATRIIDGIDGLLNSSNNVLKIRVIREGAGDWHLFRDITGTGTSFLSEGSSTDATYQTSAFFGILVKQSTASFFQRHYFDDIEVKNFVRDVLPPAIVSATATSLKTLDILFDEPVSLSSSQISANYNVSNNVGFPISAVRDAANIALVHLTFSNAFPERANLTITVSGVEDLAGNILQNKSASFSFFSPRQSDVLIHEIMADPTPVVGLPASEWLELKNVSGFDIDLQGWRIGKSSGLSGPLPKYLLKKDSLVVICTASAVAGLQQFAAVLSVTAFPSLSNEGDLIYVQSKEGRIIHSVNYNDQWYQNELKKMGGWTLEMIDSKNPCGEMNNWRASTDAKGGTPGQKNSIAALNPDAAAPKLTRAFASDPLHITLVFDESLDSSRASSVSNYNIDNGIGIPIAAVVNPITFSTVTLTVANTLQGGTIYNVSTSGTADCAGNIIATGTTVRLSLFEKILPYDIVVNEILFNPKPDAEDYVEMYNRSQKTINLKNLYLANRNTAGIVSSITQVSSTDYALFPGDFIIATKSASTLIKYYIAEKPEAILELSLPSYNDDKGNIIILNEQGTIIDEIKYNKKWHFALLNNDEGVALERIRYDDTTTDPLLQQRNWHSAASSVGFGTPTYKNSQSTAENTVAGTITVSPDIVSPDNDGRDDFATITYNFPSPGYVANITIFDAQGRPVRYLQRNALNGLSGFYVWDGLAENKMALPAGIYIIYTEVFNLEGKVKKFKNTIVLARR